MKIVWISDSIDLPTGYGRQSFWIGEVLKSLGHEVIFIGMHCQFQDIVIFEGFKLYRIHGQGDFDMIYNILQKERPDVTFAMWDIRMIHHILDNDERLGCPFYMYYLLDGDPLPYQYNQYYKKSEINWIPGSTFLYKLFKDMGAKTSNPIPLMVKDNLFYPEPKEKRIEILNKLGYGHLGNKVRFGFVGKWMRRKGIVQLMEAYHNYLPKSIQDDSALMLYAQPYNNEGLVFDELMQNVFDNDPNIIKMTANNKFTDNMNDIYQCFDWHISATMMEGWGMTTVEAMMAGVPTFITDAGTAKEITRWKGLRIPVGATELLGGLTFHSYYTHPKDIAAKMIEAYDISKNNPELYDRISQFCLRSSSRFTVENITKNWKNLIDNIDEYGWSPVRGLRIFN